MHATVTARPPADNVNVKETPFAWRTARVAWLFLVTLQGQEVSAQTETASDANVLATATDAYGERVGTEQVGLYNENQARGFSLRDTGAYRLEDGYYVRAVPLADVMSDGVSVRLGLSNARSILPSASGLVDYRLARVSDSDQDSMLRIGIKQQGSPYFEAQQAIRASALTVLAGVGINPLMTYGDGTKGWSIEAGAVSRIKSGSGASMTVFFGNKETSFGGNYGFRSESGEQPPHLTPGRNYSAPWAKTRFNEVAIGALLESAPSAPWRGSASLFYARTDFGHDDFTLLSTGTDRTANAVTVITGPQYSDAVSAEARMLRDFAAGGLRHTLIVGFRGRISNVSRAESLEIGHGRINLDALNYGVAPLRPKLGSVGRDRVKQWAATAAYQLQTRGGLEIRAGMHPTVYDKTVFREIGGGSRARDTQFLYNVSAILTRSPWTFYAMRVRSLEESGVAPQFAANRNEVLPVVSANLTEFGLQRPISPTVSLSLAAFEIEKPIPGMRADGVFDLVGSVRHRGLEISLGGSITPATRLLFGGMWLRPTLSASERGMSLPGKRPVGVSETRVVFGLEQKIAEGLSIDGQANWHGPRWADAANSWRTKGYALLNLGARYRFKVRNGDMMARLLIINALADDSWAASPNNLFQRQGPRMLNLSIEFRS